jgi:hypothetical protein
MGLPLLRKRWVNFRENPYWELRQIKGAAYLTRPFRRGLLATFAHISLLVLLFSSAPAEKASSPAP